MELIMEQFPIVIHSLNVGFLQTLKLFFATLLGAIPLGLVIAFGSMSHFKTVELYYEYCCMDHTWYTAYDPDAYHLLFPGTGLRKPNLG